MSWFVTFLEGILSFISPCTLPLVPVYISYFAGSKNTRGRALVCSLLFVAGFCIIFVILGAFAGSVGAFLTQYKTVLNIILGLIICIYGLSVLNILHLPMPKFSPKNIKMSSIFSSLLLGIVFSLALTPCTGAFLGSALMLAANAASFGRGILLLFTYSLGLGLPFILAALLTDSIFSVFSSIQKHRIAVERICGVFLIITGILTALGLFNGSFLSWEV